MNLSLAHARQSCCLSIFIVLGGVQLTLGDVFEWTTAADGTFSAAANWTPLSGSRRGPPNATDEARFNEAGTYVVTFDGDAESASVLVLQGDVTFRSVGTGHTYDIVVSEDSTQDHNGEVRIHDAKLTLGVSREPLRLDVGDTLSVSASGELDILHGSRVVVARLAAGGPTTVRGTGSALTVTGPSPLDDPYRYVYEMFVQDEGTASFERGLEVYGSLAVSGGGDVSVQGTFNIKPLGTAAESVLSVTGDGSSFITSGYRDLNVGRANSNASTRIDIADAGQFTLGSGTTTVLDSGEINVNAGSFVTDGDLVVDGGDIEVVDGSLDVTNGSLRVTGGMLSASGGIISVPESRFNPGAGDVAINGGVLELSGDSLLDTHALAIAGASSLNFIGGAIRIAGGVFDTASSLAYGGSESENRATFEFTSGTEATTPFGWRIGHVAGSYGKTMVSGRNFSEGIRSQLRGTGGGAGADLIIGVSGDGELEVFSGAFVSFGDDMIVAENPGSRGRVLVSGTTFQDFASYRSTIDLTRGGSGATASFGAKGAAVIEILDGGLINVGDDVFLAPGTAGQASVTVAGRFGASYATLQAGDNLYVGGTGTTVGGTAMLSVNLDGRVLVANTMRVFAGSEVSVSSGGRIDVNTLDVVGGTVTMTGGRLDMLDTGGTTASAGAVIDLPGGLVNMSGPLQLVGGSSLMIDGGHVIVNGTVDVSEDSRVSLTSGQLSIADNVTIGSGTLFPHSLELGFDTTLSVGGTTTIAAGRRIVLDGGFFVTEGLVVESFGGFVFRSGWLSLNDTTFTGLDQLVVPSGGTLFTRGNVAIKLNAVSGSIVTLVDDTVIGDAEAVNGVFVEGELRVDDREATLLDKNDVVFDSGAFVTIGNFGFLDARPGSMSAGNGLTLDFGGNIAGFGTIKTPNDVAYPLVNNGHITGESQIEPITLTGYIKGVGSCDNCNITGTDAPGFSTAAVNRGSVSYNGDLEIEVGGTAPGSGHDQLNHVLGDGVANLGGRIGLHLLNGFYPSPFDTFEILTAASLLGTFDNVASGDRIDTLGGEGSFVLNYDGDTNAVVLSDFLPTPLFGDVNLDGIINGLDIDPFVDVLLNGSYQTEADMNEDQVVNGLDVDPFVSAVVASGTQPIPEPSTRFLVLVALGLFGSWRRR